MTTLIFFISLYVTQFWPCRVVCLAIQNEMITSRSHFYFYTIDQERLFVAYCFVIKKLSFKLRSDLKSRQAICNPCPKAGGTSASNLGYVMLVSFKTASSTTLPLSGAPASIHLLMNSICPFRKGGKPKGMGVP